MPTSIEHVAGQPAMRIALYSSQGPRENLEDTASAFSVLGGPPEGREAFIAMVLDGVGGNRYGEVASDLAKRQLGATLAAFGSMATDRDGEYPIPPDEILGVLCRALVRGNQTILRRVVEEPQLKGMATTAVCALVIAGVLHVGWAGDSRCYLFRRGTLKQITRDHSQAQELVEAGVIATEEAQNHPLAHTITRYLGQSKGFQPETQTRRIAPDDIVLLCTDGLTDVVSDRAISSWLSAYQEGECPFEELPTHLGKHALLAGTQDNVTVLCCEYQPQERSRLDLGRTLTGSYRLELAKTLHGFSEGEPQ